MSKTNSRANVASNVTSPAKSRDLKIFDGKLELSKLLSIESEETSKFKAEIFKQVEKLAENEFIETIADKSFEKFLKDAGGIEKINSSPVAQILSQRLVDDTVTAFIVVVKDKVGNSIPGIPIELKLEEANGSLKLIDKSRTNRDGIALVRNSNDTINPSATYTITTKFNNKTKTLSNIAQDNQFNPIDFELNMVFTEDDLLKVAKSILGVIPENLTITDVLLSYLGDNPFSRLPVNFPPELAMQLHNLIGNVDDPIFNSVGSPNDFRKKRSSLIKRFSVVKSLPTNLTGANDPSLRKFVIGVRQEWIFVGYTLGELHQIDPLDPGAILEENTKLTNNIVENLSSTINTLVNSAQETILDTLKVNSSIDALLAINTRVNASTVAGGAAISLPFLVAGVVGTNSNISTSTRASSSLKTSLDVNKSLHTLKSIFNQTTQLINKTNSTINSTTASVLKNISPLLARATNLTR